MPQPNSKALEFLLSRRSRPAKTLVPPVPGREALLPILTAAARSPDHGKLEPWRFIVLERKALLRLSKLVETCGKRLSREQNDITKAKLTFSSSHLAVAVIESPKASDKIPVIEQTYSAGAVCLALLNASLASGWGANWITGWPAHDREFVEAGLGLSSSERVSGIIHIGTETIRPTDRPRPEIASITEWMSQ